MSDKKKVPEFKTFDFEVKEIDESEGTAQIKGYASTFGNLDLGFDIVDVGAFAKTIKENPNVPILADHDPRAQLGWNETAEEDKKGLKVVGLLELAVQKSVERLALAKRALALKARSGLSIGYYTVKSEPDQTNRGIRRLKELKLIEYSFVTFPMNTSAFITGAKAHAGLLSGLDSVSEMVKHLINNGVKAEEIRAALDSVQAATNAETKDPGELAQSYDRMLKTLKGL